jgi:Mu-like prophage I protein
MGDQFIVSAPTGSEGYVELGATPRARGRVFRKHILNLGDLHYKGKTFTLDDGWYGQLEKNFNAGVSMAQVPLANDKNEHTEAPLANTGEVVGIERKGSKVYTLVDIRDPDVAQRIADGRILGASAYLHMDYEDTRTGQRVGPALLHHCLTNRPHVLDLEPYEEVVAATSSDSEEDEFVVLASPEEPRMGRDELIAQLKAEHGIDVEDLQAQVSQRADMSQLTAALTEALRPAGGAVQLTGEGEAVSLTDVVGAVAELAEKNVTLTGTVGALQKDAAEREIDGYIGAGRLLPKSRRKAVELVLSGDREGLEDFLAPENAPYVKLNHAEGAAPPQGEQRHTADIDGEIARLTSQAGTSHFFSGNGSAK